MVPSLSLTFLSILVASCSPLSLESAALTPSSVLNTEILFLPQGLCTCCDSCWEHPLFRPQFKYQLLREAFLDLPLPRFISFMARIINSNYLSKNFCYLFIASLPHPLPPECWSQEGRGLVWVWVTTVSIVFRIVPESEHRRFLN